MDLMRGPSRWQLKQEVHRLRARVIDLEQQVEALEGVATAVVDTAAIARTCGQFRSIRRRKQGAVGADSAAPQRHNREEREKC